MDVLVGPTFSIDVSSYGPPPHQDSHHGHGRLYVRQNGLVETRARAEEVSSDSSSSIGAPDDSEDDSKADNGDGDEVESKFNGGGGLRSLGSFSSLEDSLPIKRGLSNYFSGKSKSFASLSEVCSSVTASSVKEVLEKRDNPFNKRRRVLIASKWSRKSSSSLYNWPNPKSMPLLALDEEEEEKDDEHEHRQQSDQSSSDEKEQQEQRRIPKRLLDKGLKSFKSRSCYCLSDLQEHKQ